MELSSGFPGRFSCKSSSNLALLNRQIPWAIQPNPANRRAEREEEEELRGVNEEESESEQKLNDFGETTSIDSGAELWSSKDDCTKFIVILLMKVELRPGSILQHDLEIKNNFSTIKSALD
ncbi:hypothetical protein K1719_015590 [Acacia pycnantha]|nr:hypothetical protein K1719_015590 [Acacia pycnantha]